MSCVDLRPPWSRAEAWSWYEARPWLCGVNYVPSTAVNTTEMWQADTFDAQTIERELGWAARCGLNCVRVFVQYVIWRHDPDGLVERLDHFLALAHAHGLTTMLVLLDDCAMSGKDPYLGPQDEPIPGRMASSWTPSPGRQVTRNPAEWPKLKAYVQALVRRFAGDERVLAWDLYNEPGQGLEEVDFTLLAEVFRWVRECDHAQPVTSGLYPSAHLTAIEEIVLTSSDILSLHHYGPLSELEEWIDSLNTHGRPVIVTEWMARPLSSCVSTHLPMLKAARIGCMNWGLVNGRMQTHLPWSAQPGDPEPELWFHDLLRSDGRPYDEREIALLTALTGSRS